MLFDDEKTENIINIKGSLNKSIRGRDEELNLKSDD
jgi:hypothetical protein